MKILVFVVVSAVVGVGLGLGFTWREFGGVKEQFHGLTTTGQPGDTVATANEYSRVEVVGENRHDFGTMGRYSTRSHTFTIRNTGTAPLLLEVQRTSCKCTLSDMENDRLAPGNTTEITMEWKAEFPPGPFEQTAEIRTNDPENRLLQLTVHGVVLQSVRAIPPEVAVGRISANDEVQTQFRIYSYMDPDLKLENWEFDDASAAEDFEVEFRPLTEDELQGEIGAKAGMLAEVRVKPGLPPGTINQKIRLLTNYNPGSPLEVALMGTVVGDIQLAGPRQFKPSLNLLDFGPVDRQAGAIVDKLKIIVKGPHRDDIQLEVGNLEPEGYLDVVIGEKQVGGNGKTVWFPLSIAIRTGQQRINRLGNVTDHGVVTIKTNHPQSETFPIYVRFAVD